MAHGRDRTGQLLRNDGRNPAYRCGGYDPNTHKCSGDLRAQIVRQHELHVGDPRGPTSGSIHALAEGDCDLHVKKGANLDFDGGCNISASDKAKLSMHAKSIIIEAKEKITLSVGGSSIVIMPDKVYVSPPNELSLAGLIDPPIQVRSGPYPLLLIGPNGRIRVEAQDSLFGSAVVADLAAIEDLPDGLEVLRCGEELGASVLIRKPEVPANPPNGWTSPAEPAAAASRGSVVFYDPAEWPQKDNPTAPSSAQVLLVLLAHANGYGAEGRDSTKTGQ